MKEYLKFSVTMCVYGGDNPDYFDLALSSIICQTVQPNEIVLAADGPIPETITAIIEKYQRQLAGSAISFKVIYLEKNVGLGRARQICLEHCSCELVALMDADDLSVPERFELQLCRFDAHPKVSVIGGNIREFIDTPENCVGRRVVPETDEGIRNYMKKRCPMNHVTVMFRKKDVTDAGGYLHWHYNEDYYLWIRLALAGYRFGNVNEELVNVRIGKEMYRRRGGIKYFKSEAKLQTFMLKNKLINPFRYVVNVAERFILQVLMPNWLRGFLFRKLARKPSHISPSAKAPAEAQISIKLRMRV